MDCAIAAAWLFQSLSFSSKIGHWLAMIRSTVSPSQVEATCTASELNGRVVETKLLLEKAKLLIFLDPNPEDVVLKLLAESEENPEAESESANAWEKILAILITWVFQSRTALLRDLLMINDDISLCIEFLILALSRVGFSLWFLSWLKRSRLEETATRDSQAEPNHA